MNKIFATTMNAHDHNWYDGELHYQAERYTRQKRNVYKNSHDIFYEEFFKSKLNQEYITAFTYTRGGIQLIDKENPFKTSLKNLYEKIQKYNPSWNHLWDYLKVDNTYYINHHQSHAAYAYLTSKFKESDILIMDGGGIDYCSVFFDKNGNKNNLSYDLPIGYLWNLSCHFSNMPPSTAGKLMGLSAYGKFNDEYYTFLELIIEDLKLNKTKRYNGYLKMYKDYIGDVPSPFDIAYTMQEFTLDKVKEHVFPLKTSNNICMAGGVTYNGYMNEMFTAHYNNVFVPPAVGDEGQSLGTYMHADFVLNKNIHIPNTYAGQEYEIKLDWDNLNIKEVAQEIANGAIIGWMQDKSESGNRALGNRSILADPRRKDIKDIINSKIKLREDYRPFAPSVLEEHYKDYFDTPYPSPYMSRIVKVISDKIPGVTHIDNTARIQTVNSNQNKKFYDLINEFYKITGIPMLLNTSFNCQEPIVETHHDAIATFEKTGLDILVINDYMRKK